MVFSNMRLKVSKTWTRLRAAGTVERLFSWVFSIMALKRWAKCKGLRADGTLKRLVWMRYQVSLKVCIVGESFSAVSTLKRSISSVFSRVDRESWYRCKRLWTVIAFIQKAIIFIIIIDIIVFTSLEIIYHHLGLRFVIVWFDLAFWFRIVFFLV